MKENTDEKSLVEVNENSIFYKIKTFFKNLFHKSNNVNVIQETRDITIENESKKNAFMEEIRKVEDEETELLKLQKQYRRGEITENELTDEQVNSLCELYDKQISDLKKSNEMRKKRLLEYRRKLQTDN